MGNWSSAMRVATCAVLALVAITCVALGDNEVPDSPTGRQLLGGKGKGQDVSVREDFKCSPFTDRDLKPWITRTQTESGITIQAVGSGNSDSFKISSTANRYPGGTSLKAKIEWLKKASVASRSVWLAASSHIKNKLYTAKIVDAKEIAHDRGDCWIATSIGERHVKAQFGGSEAGSLKALFLKMTVCKRGVPGAKRLASRKLLWVRRRRRSELRRRRTAPKNTVVKCQVEQALVQVWGCGDSKGKCEFALEEYMTMFM